MVPFSTDTLIAHLKMLTDYLEYGLSEADFFRVFKGNHDAYEVGDAVSALEAAGYKADFGKARLSKLDPILFPVLVFDANGLPFLVLDRKDKDRFLVVDVSSGSSEPQIWRRWEPRLREARWILRVSRKHRSGEDYIARQDHWFWSAFRDLHGVYIQIILAAMVSSVLGLTTSLFTMVVYDRILPNEAVDSLLALVVGVAFALMFDFLIKNLRSRFIETAGKRADMQIAERLFNQLIALKMKARGGQNGRMTSILRDFEVVRDFFTSASLITLVDLPFLFVFIGVIWFIGGPLALVPAAAVPITLIAGLMAQPFLSRYASESSIDGQTKQAVLMETLTGVETIKTTGAEPIMRSRWNEAVKAQANSSGKTRLLSQGTVNLTLLVQQIAQVAILFYGVFLVRDGTISVGALIASVILAGKALTPLSQLAQVMTRLNKARIAYCQIDTLMEQEVEREYGRRYLSRPTIAGQIEFKGVHFTYDEVLGSILKDIDLSIKPGEKVAILGPVGSGKSTVARLILGLYEPNDGAVLLDGLNARNLDPADKTRNIGAVLQDCWLFSGTLRENIIAGRFKITDTELHQKASISLADRIASQHPHGYDMRIQEGGFGVSGGQRQTIAIARALIGDPPILVMDEPTSGMDVPTEVRVIENLKTWLSDDRTLVLVTHRASLLQLVDRVIVLNNGKITYDGSKEEILMLSRPKSSAVKEA
ncbi:type I secretion system permease/ATPase [Ruegeria atlantica]|uniref:type I secretion system permease/ATPase n=1 Tax=Ruegeria atlantica TaxID=81569 RepID=UPI0014800676|nr:type I secretion system permease/ATPase [Ruegeria atlantica]